MDGGISAENYFQELVDLIPQKEPFRFVDSIHSATDQTIEGSYAFPKESWFYRGHFVGRPITPGVILLETMAQIGVVAFWIHLLRKGATVPGTDLRNAKIMPLFANANVEFIRSVYPGDRVNVSAEKVYFRRGKLCCDTVMTDVNGSIAARARISGQGVTHEYE
jgi:3-hydroxyacyl-[acyl-carrier-protein] dehydratase